MANFWQKVTLASVATVAGIAATIVYAEPSLAQRQRQVTCESLNSRRVSCQMETQDGVQIERQYSQTPCRGKWGFGRGYVWVEDGCRARFSSLGGRDNRNDDNERYNNRRYPRDNDNARYNGRRDSGDDYENINQIYRDVLDRDVDRRGYRVYSDRIKDGWSLSRVRREIARSSEAREAISRLYQRVLGRDADPEGLRTYQRSLEDGGSLRSVEREIARSQEARERRRN